MNQPDPVIEADLHAYVDNQLNLARRIDVEAYLSQHPENAAKVMADLRIRDELRLALAGPVSTPHQNTREAARQLESAINRPQTIDVFRRAAAIVLLIGAGWVAHGWIAPSGIGEVVASVPPPQFVEEAMRAHKTAELRESIPQLSATDRFDPAEIRSATAIELPQMPADWSVRDAQVFPSTFGPSVELEIEAGEGRRLALFAVRPGAFAVQQVLMQENDNAKAAYWQIGEVAYALISETEQADRLADEARRLARTLY